MDSRTYQGNLGEFGVVKYSTDWWWLDTLKWKEQEFYARAMAELRRIPFGRPAERGNVRYARLGLIKWLKYSPRKSLRGKFPVRYQGLTLRVAVNVDFSFLNKLFGLKIDDKLVQYLMLLFGRKIGILGFVAKQTVICSENREV